MALLLFRYVAQVLDVVSPTPMLKPVAEKVLICGLQDGSIHIAKLFTWEIVSTFNAHDCPINAIDVSSDGLARCDTPHV